MSWTNLQTVGVLVLWAVLCVIASQAKAATLYIDGKRITNATITITTEAVPTVPTVPPVPTVPDVVEKCRNSATIVCKYAISASQWASTRKLVQVVAVPKGKTLVSAFHTNGRRKHGSMQFSEWAGVSTNSTDVWISATPAGEPLSKRCHKPNSSFVFTLKYTQYDGRYCTLKRNTTYYLNMRQVDPNEEEGVMERRL